MKELFGQIWNMPAADLSEMLEMFITAVLLGFGWTIATFIVVGSLCYAIYKAYYCGWYRCSNMWGRYRAWVARRDNQKTQKRKAEYKHYENF